MGQHQIDSSAAISSLRQHFPDVEPRYERKFRLPINLAETMKTRLAAFGFFHTFPDRCVNSQYFDTDALNFARENISGERHRLKTRMRWYEVSKLPKSGKLEIKCKDGPLGYKFHFDLGSPERRVVQDRILTETGLLTEVKCVTRYNRSYFQNSQGIRATIDENLLAQNSCINSNTFVRLGYSVLEIKYPKSLDSVYREFVHPKISTLIAIRLNKSSKYVEGLSALGLV